MSTYTDSLDAATRSAALSAAAARASADLVSSPADAAVAAIVSNTASQTVTNLDVRYAIGSRTEVNALTYGTNGAAIQQAINAAEAMGTGAAWVHIPAVSGGWSMGSTQLVVSSDGLIIRGDGILKTQLNYQGPAGTACITTNNAAIRRHCHLADLYVSCITAGATALALDNAYRWIIERCRLESTNGTTGIGVDLIGSLAKATYYNVLRDCTINGSFASVRMNDNVNRCRVEGGVLEGAGYAVLMTAPNANMGTHIFMGTGIASTGANTGNAIVQIGLSTDAYQCSYNTFLGCTLESDAPAGTTTYWNNEVKGWYNAIIGGSLANGTVVSDKVTQAGAGLLQLMHSGSSGPALKMPATLAGGSFTSTGAFITGPGGVNETTYGQGYVRTTGGTNTNLYLASKGTGAVFVNGSQNDGTGALNVYSGGASSTLRAVIGGGGRGALLQPASGSDAIWVYKAAGANPDFKIGEDGKLSWGDPGGSGTFDATLSRSAPAVLNLAGSLQRPIATKTASYTLVAGDAVVVFNGATLTATLPDPTATATIPAGTQFIVKNINASALTVNSAGTSKTIDGAASVSLAQWAVGRYVTDGTQWLNL